MNAALVGRPRLYPPVIGAHLATLNLLREANGSVRLAVVEAKGARHEAECLRYPRPIDYVETLVIEAAARLTPLQKH